MSVAAAWQGSGLVKAGDACILIAGLLLALVCAPLAAQPSTWLAPQEPVAINADSGRLSNSTDHDAILYSTQVRVPEATWLRVAFDEVALPGRADGASARVRLTSLFDGAVQVLDRRGMRQWKNTSAYFNGDGVLVELISPPGVGPCRIVIKEALRDAELAVPHNTCGPTDDRLPSNDPRVARLLPIGCTGWLIRDANFCFLSAGHCATSGGAGLQVIQFNVPLSNPNGSLNHPPPQHQYATDLASVQVSTPPIAIGNDWTYFGAFDNSTTNLTAYETQGAAFTLTTVMPPVAGQALRKTGYGTTSSPISNTWNQAQKTLAGPITAITGTQVTYAVDSSGGDSGSPVTDNEIAIAIHTNGGCNSVGYNSGCSVRHPDLLNALANPTGVCIPRYFDVSFPSGRPAIVQTLGGTELIALIEGRNGYTVDPSSVRLHYSTGGSFESTQMIATGAGQFSGVFPPLPCAATVRYYVAMANSEGGPQIDPVDAPMHAYYTFSAHAVTPIVSYDFETVAGWTVQNTNVTGGAWARGIPAGDGTRGDPIEDYDGSGQCWLTGNAPGDSDVDGGPTRLLSPSWNLSATSRPFVSYSRWFTNDNQDVDRLTVELSNNFGVNWSTIESVADSVGWTARYVDVAAILPPTNVTRIRFGVADEPNNSRTEAAVDAVAVFDVTCPPAGACHKGDVNLDGRVNGGDIQPFVAQVLVGGTPGSLSACAADVNGDAVANGDDVAQFIACVMSGGCP